MLNFLWQLYQPSWQQVLQADVVRNMRYTIIRHVHEY